MTADLLTTRPPAVAGIFYPAHAQKLRSDIDEMMSEAEHTPIPSVSAVIVPHAGYVYSGRVAAAAFRQLGQTPWDVVVVMSPNHRDYFRGVSVYPGNYRTPLGVVPVDATLAKQLSEAHPQIVLSRLGHQQEHGIEVELPFLQYLFGEFVLLPIVMADQGWAMCERLASALEKVLSGKKVLVVASSDLSHFHRQEEAQVLDHHVISDVEMFDERRLHDDIRAGRCEACGYGPIIVSMMMARRSGCHTARVLTYRTSGDSNHDYNEVVGYLAGVMN